MRFPRVFSLAGLLAAAFDFAHATNKQYDMIGLWGRNLAQNQFRSVIDQEPPLATICQTTNYTILQLSFMYYHFDAQRLPGIDLDLHCRWPTNKFPNYPSPPAGYNILNCPDVGKDIQACQSLGKKIVISVSPMDFLNSTSDAATSAENVWNVFLGGSSAYRPFGSAVLDGVDLHVWNNDPHPQFYTTFAARLRQLMNGDTSRRYYLSGSSICQYPDILLGGSTRPNTPLHDIPTSFDYLVPFFISSPNICGWEGNNAGFWSYIKQWSDFIASATPNTRLFLGLPSWSTPEWAQASPGDYIAPSVLYSDDVVPRLKQLPNFVGFALQDVSFDVLNKPCAGDSKTIYSAVLYQQLVADIGVSGSATPGNQQCNASSTASTTSSSATNSGSQATSTSTPGPDFWGSQNKNVTSSALGGRFTVVAVVVPLVLLVVIGVLV